MTSGVTSVFGEPDEFQEALREDGVANLLVVGSGQFRARLTQVTLDELRLSGYDEQLSRIAFVTAPANNFHVSFLISDQPGLFWAGVETQPYEMIAFGAGVQVHVRTKGRCRWGAICLPRENLTDYGRTLRGAELDLPLAARWRPPRAAFRLLRSLHLAAVRATEGRSGTVADRQAAHGLKQQVIHALVECLSAGVIEEERPLGARHRDILARFEDLVRANPGTQVPKMSAALGISERTLLACCNAHLGIGPDRYLRLRRMQQVNRALRRTDPRPASVADVAAQYGISNMGRFSAAYHAIYDEYPSETLHGARQAGVGVERPRMKFP